MDDADRMTSAATQRLLDEERAATVARIESLSRQIKGIVESSEWTTNDDEHDPEGATIAFERAQLQSLLDQARADVEGLDRAEKRLRDGAYGVCEHCGKPIAAARLEVLSAATRCISCAR
jgi:DnaK suppressor protein